MKRRRRRQPARKVEPADGSIRLDAAVRDRFSLSWNKARERITRGKIWIDGVQVVDIGLRVQPNVELEPIEDARLTRPEDILLPPEAIRLADRDLVVVEKPAGILTVPFAGETDTLVRVVGTVLTRREHSRARERVFVVHRLDFGTSGLLVFARTKLTRDRLKDQFRHHTVHRRYLALVEGHIESQRVETHLVRDRGDGVRGSVERQPPHMRRKLSGGRIAITHVEALETLETTTLIACRLETGRTNQIRIHLSELGHPLVGETVYRRDHGKVEKGACRLCLHAAELGFEHPCTKQPLRFESPVPEAMQVEIDGRR